MLLVLLMLRIHMAAGEFATGNWQDLVFFLALHQDRPYLYSRRLSGMLVDARRRMNV